MKFIGCDVFKHLHHGGIAKYTSQRTIQESLKVMGKQLRESQLMELRHCDHYSIMIDESTDVSVIKELVIYVRYLSASGEIKNSFLSIVELPKGTAEVNEQLVPFLKKSSILLSHLVGFASDRANVMTGCHNGVAVRLARRQPLLTSIHCVAHRLALAASQAGDDVRYISNTFKPTLQQLFYFYEISAVRIAGLKAIEQLLQIKELKLKKSVDKRWLSVDNACQTLVKVLPAVITSLESEAEDRGQALAHGLCKVVKWFKFIATLYMMYNVLPDVSRLS